MTRDDRSSGAEKRHIAKTIPVLEEELKVGKRERVTGRVQVHMNTRIVEEIVEQELESIHAHVTRIAIGRDLDPGEPVPAMRTQDGLTIIPVLEEVLVVETRLRLVEELHIKQQKSVETVSTPVPLRKQTAEVEQLSDDRSDLTQD